MINWVGSSQHTSVRTTLGTDYIRLLLVTTPGFAKYIYPQAGKTLSVFYFTLSPPLIHLMIHTEALVSTFFLTVSPATRYPRILSWIS